MFFRFLRVISILSFVFMLSGCKKEDTDTSSASGETTGATTAGTNTGTTPTTTPTTPKVIIKYSCMCDPDTGYHNDIPRRLRAQNSSTIEEATLEITQACKNMKAGEQEVNLFACLERL